MVATTIYNFDPTIPVTATKAAPATINMDFPVYQVDRIEIKIPHGPNGLVGFYLASMGQQIIPYQSGQYIIGDDDDIAWDLTDLMTSGAWSLVGYNLGQWPHTIYVRFLVEPVPSSSGSSGLIIPSSALTSD